MIELILFIALYVIFPIIWIFGLRASGLSFLKISLPSILLGSMLLFQHVGYFSLFFFLDPYRAYLISDRSIIWEMFLWNIYTISFLMVGFITARFIVGKIQSVSRFNVYADNDITLVKSEIYIFISIILVGVFILIGYITSIGWGNLAIVSAIGLVENEMSIELLRSQMTNAYGANYHWYRFITRDLLSLACVGAFAQWLITRKIKHFFVFNVGLLCSVFSSLIATEKSPILWLLISLCVAYLIVKKKGRIPPSIVFKILPISVSIIGVLYVFFMGADDFRSGLLTAFSRIFTGQIEGLYHYFNIFPNQVGFLNGRSFPNPMGVLPWESYRLTTEVMDIVKPQLRQMGIIGSMPTVFWGEMYANFGYAGVIIPPVFIGFCVYLLNRLFFFLMMSPLTVALFTWLFLHIKNLAVTGLSSYIFNIQLLIIVLLSFILLGISYKGKIPIKTSIL